MKQNDFYEVDGCTDFIPVKLIKEHKHFTNTLEVELTGSGYKSFVPSIYSFPKVNEPQKVVVPKFVAEWIKKYKEKGYRLSHALVKVFDDAELSLYIKQQVGDYTETIAKAWLTYPNITVEQEKLYTVEIPDPNSNWKYRFLSRHNNGIYLDASNYAKWKQKERNQLTEAEIKQDFEWAWDAGFAKEVE